MLRGEIPGDLNSFNHPSMTIPGRKTPLHLQILTGFHHSSREPRAIKWTDNDERQIIPIKKILVTGAAGFIGFHVTARLLASGATVVGLDNLNTYYDEALKHARLRELGITKAGEGSPVKSALYDHCTFLRADLRDRDALDTLFAREQFDAVIHLAAQAGVRYSLTHPFSYAESNLEGFLVILECCRRHGQGHLLFASSSSVYGLHASGPFSLSDSAAHPLSLYAATKRANELMAHSYSHLFRIPVTGMRFFTVYGPWGRPDMAYFSFTKALFEGSPIALYNNGHMKRDFTYVDDIVEAVARLIEHPPAPDPSWNLVSGDPSRSSAPYRLYNLGNNHPVELTHFLAILEKETGRKAFTTPLPMQPGDMEETFASLEGLADIIGFCPATPLEEGLSAFVRWYRNFYGVERK